MILSSLLAGSVLLIASSAWAGSAPKEQPFEEGFRIGQVQLRKKGYVPLKKLLKRFSGARKPTEKERLLAEISARGPRAGKPLLALALRGRSRRTRAMAFRGLGMVGYERAIPSLRRALTDRHSWIRSNAAWSLGQLNAKSAIKDLTRRLAREKRAVVVEQIVTALERMGAVDEMEAIKKAGAHSSPFTRSWVLRTVGNLGDSVDARYVAGFLDDEDQGVRETAVEIFSSLTGKDFNIPKDPTLDVEPAITRAREYWESEGRYQ